MTLILAISAAIFGADLSLKAYLRTNFAFQSIPVIKNIFHITVVFNKGAAFGILQEKTLFLAGISVIFILFFLFIIKKKKKRTLLFLIACGLILGGAASNLHDRIFLGFVVDYLDFRIWPVFNLSDSCITVGAFLLLWESYRKPKRNINI